MSVAEFCFAFVGGAFIGLIIVMIVFPPLFALFGWWLDIWFGD